MSGTPTSLSSAVAVLGLAGGSSSHGGLAAVTWAARRGPPGPSTTVPAALFLARDGRRLDRHGAGRIVRTTARRAGIATAVTPHTLRHAFTTAALGRRVAAAGRAGSRLARRSADDDAVRPGPRQPGPARDLRRSAVIVVHNAAFVTGLRRSLCLRPACYLAGRTWRWRSHPGVLVARDERAHPERAVPGPDRGWEGKRS